MGAGKMLKTIKTQGLQSIAYERGMNQVFFVGAVTIRSLAVTSRFVDLGFKLYNGVLAKLHKTGKGSRYA